MTAPSLSSLPSDVPPGLDTAITGFARLAALEAAARALPLSVMPILLYRDWGSDSLVSVLYLIAGLASLCWSLVLPALARHIPRGVIYRAAGLFYVLSAVLAIWGGAAGLAIGLGVGAMATVTFWVCHSAYVLDVVPREALGRNESVRMVWSGASWALGPALGVFAHDLWPPLPFLASGAFGLLLILLFGRMALGDGREIARAEGTGQSPRAVLGRFLRRPRLVAGWTFAVVRSCGWWVYIVYLPIFCVQQGLDDKVAGVALSLSNALLFATPLMLRLMDRLGVRRAVRLSFAAGAVLFCAATLVAPWPPLTVAALMGASVLLVMLDVCASLPFLMAVKPSERTEMAAVYSSFRDVSGILTPAAAGLVLLVAPVAAVFGLCGLAFGGAWALAGRLHPRLGRSRSVRD